MRISLERVGKVDVATLQSHVIDSDNVKEFKQGMTGLLEERRLLVLDLARVEFLDSSGLGAILHCLRRLTAHGGDLRLCGLTRPVRTLFELVRMHKIFEIFPTAEEAVRSYERT